MFIFIGSIFMQFSFSYPLMGFSIDVAESRAGWQSSLADSSG